MTREVPPFRADHVGSLLRPPELLRARGNSSPSDLSVGRPSGDDLRAVEDAAVADAVAMQERVGLRSATDGEFRRTSWHMDFMSQLGGVSLAQDPRPMRWYSEQGAYETSLPAVKVGARLHLEHTIFGDAFTSLRDMARTATPKLTIPSPSMVHYRGGAVPIDPGVYPDPEEYWSDLAATYAEEVRRLHELGCTYLQLDDTSLAMLNDPRDRAMVADRGDDPDRLHQRYIRTINAALADRPAGLSVTTHMCRGNYSSRWHAEGSYEFVAEALFNELEVDGFFMEFDDERSGGFEPLRFVPAGKVVVLGLVTTKRGELERKDDLKRRIDEASRFVPLDQLCLSPQCGFASGAQGNDLTHAEQEAKLRLVVETATEVWG